MLKTRSPLYIKFPENAPITAPNKKLFLFNEIFENLKKIFAKKKHVLKQSLQSFNIKTILKITATITQKVAKIALYILIPPISFTILAYEYFSNLRAQKEAKKGLFTTKTLKNIDMPSI